MKLPKNSGGGSDFELTPDGNHLAVCFQVIDLGTHTITYKDTQKEQRKVMIGWELPHERMSDGRPFMVKKRYTFSSHEKATMRRDLESWRGKKFQESDFGPGGFDIKNLLGKGCFLQVVHNDVNEKTYANVASIGSLPKGTVTPALENEVVYLSLDPEDFEPSTFEALPDWMKELIAESPEYRALNNYVAPPQQADAGDPDDGTPF